MVSTLETETYHFPKPFKLELRLKDVLEQEVPDKYYLSEKAINGFTEHKKRMEARGNGFGFSPTDGNTITHSVLTTSGSRPDDNFIQEQ